MSVRTKLILIFLGLSVVPLAVLTGLSYSSSIRSLRHLVERDGRAAANDLQERVASLSGEIRSRMQAVTELPDFEAVSFAVRPSPDDTVRLARAIREELGDRWDVFADLQFEAAARGGETEQAPEHRSLLAVRESTSSGDDGESNTIRVFLPDFSQLVEDTDVVPELRRYEFDLDAGEREETMTRLGDEVFDMLENLSYLPGLFVQARGDGRSIMLRNLEDGVRAQLIELETVGRVETVEEEAHLTRRKKLAILERVDRAARESAEAIVLPVERRGEKVGNVIGRVRPDRMLAKVFDGTRLDAGEIAFAVDPLGRLHARNLADLETLRGLGLAAAEAPARLGESPSAMVVTQDPRELEAVVTGRGWVTVIEKDEDTGYTFGIVRKVAAELGAIRRAAATNLFLGLVFIGLAGSGVVVFSHRMTRGLERLTDGARQIAGGDLTHRIAADRKDELGQLAVAFNEMAADLDSSRQLLVEQERLQQELDIARRIQRDSLPKGSFTGEGLEIVGRSIPCHEVGGDFFNFLPVEGGRTAIVVGDVAGKGVPAALLMAEVQATLRTMLRYDDDPAHIVQRLNRDLAGNKPDNTFITVFLGILDPRDGSLAYVNAGQTPPFLIRRDGEVIHLPPTSRPVGLFADSLMRSDTVPVQRGDLLCLYTDGVVESSASEETEEFFGQKRLVEAVRTAANRSLRSVIDEVAVRLTGFHGETTLEDDATLVVARITPDRSGDRVIPPGGRQAVPSIPDDKGLPVV